MYCISLGSQPVGVQCPLTSSLAELPGYWDWLWYPGLPPVLVSIAFPLRLPYLGVFHSLFTCRGISFMFLLYGRRICTRSIDPSLADGECPGLGLVLVPDIVIPETVQGLRMQQKSSLKFLPWPGFRPRTSQSNGCGRYPSTTKHPFDILICSLNFSG